MKRILATLALLATTGFLPFFGGTNGIGTSETAMAPTVLGSVASYAGSTTTDPHSYSATLSAGNDRLLIVCTVIRDTSDVINFVAAKYGGSGGQTMTLLDSDRHGEVEVYVTYLKETGLAAVGDGANDVWLDFSGAVRATSVAVFAQDVYQDGPLGTVGKAEGDGGAPTITFPSAAGDLAFDCLGFDDGGGSDLGAYASTGTEHARPEETVNSRVWAAAATQPGTAQANFTWAAAAAFSDWTHVGVPIKPVPAVFNNAPVAADDSATAVEGVAQNIDVLANDTDPDNNPLAVTSVTTPGDGSAVVGPGGAYVTYTATSPFTGNPDTFDYTVSDGALTDTATVTVTRSSAPTTFADQATALSAGAWAQLTTTNEFDDVALTTAEANAVCAASPDGCDIPIYTTTHPGWTTLSKWNSAAWDAANDTAYFWGSGHADGGNTEVYAFDFDTLAWARLNDPAALNVASGSYFLPEGGSAPAAQHDYDGLEWDATVDKLFTVSGNTIYNFGSPQTGVPLKSWQFDPGTLTWESFDTSAVLYYPQCVYESENARMFCIGWVSTNSKRIWLYDSATGAETDCGSNWTANGIAGGVGTLFKAGSVYYVINTNGLWQLSMNGCSTTATKLAVPSDRIVAAMGYDGDRYIRQSCPFSDGTDIWFWNTQPLVAVYNISGDSWDMIWNEDYRDGSGPGVLGGNSAGQDREFSKCHYFATEGVMAGISTPEDDAQSGWWIWKPAGNPAEIDNLLAGSLTIDGITQSTISVYLAATGDRNYDATAYIEYREVGAGSFTRGMDLVPQFTEPVRISRGLPTNGEGYYGMIKGLDPDTDYEVRVVFSDPDGLGTGSTTSPQTVASTTTLALPISDYTGFTTTTINSDDIATLNATIQTYCDSPGTGHVITIAAGVTVTGQVDVRPTTLSASNVCGTLATPLVIRGANPATSLIDADGGTGPWLASDYVILEDLTITNATTGVIVSGKSSDRETTNITVRNTTIDSTLHGIATFGYYVTNLYIADNDITGPRSALTTVTGGASYGIEVSGTGTEVEHNTIRGYIDAIAMSDPKTIGASYLNHADVFHHNWIEWNADDGIEFDFTHRNVMAHDNLIVNTADCLSFQPVWGGPAIAINNVCYNFLRGPIKIKAEIDNPVGPIQIFNNTFLGNGSAFWNVGVPTVGVDMRNNIFFAEGTLMTPPGNTAVRASGEWPLTLNTIDYNAWGQDGSFDFNKQFATSFAAWKALGPWGAHSILIDGEEATTFSFTPDFDDTGSGFVFGGATRDASDKNFQLHASSSAQDAGVQIYGVTPDGDANPDMGACEVSGCDGTTTYYGVR